MQKNRAKLEFRLLVTIIEVIDGGIIKTPYLKRFLHSANFLLLHKVKCELSEAKDSRFQGDDTVLRIESASLNIPLAEIYEGISTATD